MTNVDLAHDDARLITVCDKCLRACCWHGIFYCDDYQTAGITEKPVAELRKLDLEHSDYWGADED